MILNKHSNLQKLKIFSTLTDATCPLLQLPNGFVTGGNMYGQVVVYHCNDGFILEGDDRRTCRSDRKWSALAPTCKPKRRK